MKTITIDGMQKIEGENKLEKHYYSGVQSPDVMSDGVKIFRFYDEKGELRNRVGLSIGKDTRNNNSILIDIELGEGDFEKYKRIMKTLENEEIKMKKFNYMIEYERTACSVVEMLQKHFKKYGTVYREDNRIFLKRNKQDACCKDMLLCIFELDKVINNRAICDDLEAEIDMNDVWSEIGGNLQYVEVLPFVEFNLEKWKQDFAQKNNLSYRNKSVYNNYAMIIDSETDVNYTMWHDNLFVNKHDYFKTNRGDNGFLTQEKVIIKNKEMADEFERIYAIICNHLENLPDLNKGVDNDNKNNK